jgi:hypothetical protein
MDVPIRLKAAFWWTCVFTFPRPVGGASGGAHNDFDQAALIDRGSASCEPKSTCRKSPAKDRRLHGGASDRQEDDPSKPDLRKRFLDIDVLIGCLTYAQISRLFSRNEWRRAVRASFPQACRGVEDEHFERSTRCVGGLPFLRTDSPNTDSPIERS